MTRNHFKEVGAFHSARREDKGTPVPNCHLKLGGGGTANFLDLGGELGGRQSAEPEGWEVLRDEDASRLVRSKRQPHCRGLK